MPSVLDVYRAGGLSVAVPRAQQFRAPRSAPRDDEEEDRITIRPPIVARPTPSGPPQPTTPAPSRPQRPRSDRQPITINPRGSTPVASSDFAKDSPWYADVASAVFDNPVAKTIAFPLQAVEILGQGVSSTANELVDLAQGEGFSGQDWLDQTFAGGADYLGPSFGFEDVLGNIAESTGDATMNQALRAGLQAGARVTPPEGWERSLAGFIFDASLDPAAYMGVGLANRVGRETAEQLGRQAAKAGLEGAEKARYVKEGMRTTRQGLSGRRELEKRVSEAILLGDQRGLLTPERMRRLQEVGNKGLGGVRLDDTDRALLGIERAGIRIRRPGGKTAGTIIPGTRTPVESFQRAFGWARGRANASKRQAGTSQTRLDANRVGRMAPIDVENASRTLSLGPRHVEPDEAFRAASTIVQDAPKRAYSNRANALGLLASSRARSKILEEQKAFGGFDDYIDAVEDPKLRAQVAAEKGIELTEDGRTALNVLFDEVGIESPRRVFGVTVPRLSSGDLDYFPQDYHQDWMKFAFRDPEFKQQYADRLGYESIDLQRESGRLAGRNIGPDMDITVNGKTANTGRGTRKDIVAAARQLGYNGPVFRNDDVMSIAEDYIQTVASDVGRRAARADMAVQGNPLFQFTEDVMRQRRDQVARELSGEVNMPFARLQEVLDDYAGRPDLARQAEPDLPEEVLEALGRDEFAEIANESPTARANRIRETEIERSAAAQRVAANVRDVGPELPPSVETVIDAEIAAFDDMLLRMADEAGIPVEQMTDEVAEGLAIRMLDDPRWSQSVMDMAMGFAERLSRAMPNSPNNVPLRPELRAIQGVRSTRGSPGNILMDRGAQDMLINMQETFKNPGMVARFFWAATRFFKTYALLSVGYHIRNSYSALFMNAADGVPIGRSVRGFDLWTDFEKAARKGGDDLQSQIVAGERWLLEQGEKNPQILTAFDAVFGSGAGGRYKEVGVAGTTDETASRFTQKAGTLRGRIGRWLTDNPVTRTSQTAGTRYVEGPIRLGMALDTVENGGNLADAIGRITRTQFDYSQLSRTDEFMRMPIPFWVFMSRNLPLQVAQMWSRPAAYSRVESFRRNFSNDENLDQIGGVEGVPGYIRARGAFPVALPGFLGDNLNIADPDLPYVRLVEDIERFGQVGSPLSAMPLLSDLNPVLSAPAEAIIGRDFYTGQEFDETDVQAVDNPIDRFLWGVGQNFGMAGSEYGVPYVDQRFARVVDSVVPPVSRARRLLGWGSEVDDGRQLERYLRELGVPLRNVTPDMSRRFYRGEGFDRLDEERRVRAILDLQNP